MAVPPVAPRAPATTTRRSPGSGSRPASWAGSETSSWPLSWWPSSSAPTRKRSTQRPSRPRAGAELKREAEAVERKIAGIMAAIEDGMYTPVLKERMKVLETRKAEIQAGLASTEPPSVIRLHPNAAEIYRRKVAELELA